MFPYYISDRREGWKDFQTDQNPKDSNTLDEEKDKEQEDKDNLDEINEKEE